jgi:hypothetical protein
MLRQSDMIIADKQTETWWQQISGSGLVGKLAKKELDIIPSQLISVEDFFKRFPEGLILSPRTGTTAEGQYGINPYENYDQLDNKPWSHFFDHTKLDTRLQPMDRIIDVKGNKNYKVYPFTIIQKEGVINDRFENKNIVIFYKKGTVSVMDKREIAKSKDIGSATVFSAKLDGRVLSFQKKNGKIIDVETQSTWDITGLCIQGKMKGEKLEPEAHGNHFAFAWLNFYPDSEIYKK